VTQLGRITRCALAVVSRLLERWQSEIATGIREMQRQRKVASKIDPDQVAAALLAGIQGGVVVMLSPGVSRTLKPRSMSVSATSG
jgi:hypothetical protein